MNIDQIATVNIALASRADVLLNDWLEAWTLFQTYRGTGVEPSLRDSLEHWARRLQELNDARIAWDRLPKFNWQVAA
jgi:hypothetical protein